MKSFCFLKDCNNFDGDFDCILHYSKIQIDAQQKILLHYNAMKSRLEEMMNSSNDADEGVNCNKAFDAIYSSIKNRSKDKSALDTSETSSSLGSKNGSQVTVKKNSSAGKENSPTKKTRRISRSSKDLFKDISIDYRPSKEKRTKQTKLSFFTTSSAKKRSSKEVLEEEDEDMTYCEELERGIIKPKEKIVDKSAIEAETPDIFNFGTLENFNSKKPKEKTSTVAVESPKEVTPQKTLGIKIKTEKTDDKSFRPLPTPLSPELFLSDMSNNSNSVIFIEPQEREVISITDRTYNPTHGLLQEIQKEIKKNRKHKLFEDSNPIPTPPKIQIEERDAYEGECLDCQIFYDNIMEKKSLSDANNEINNCPIKCDGWKARCKKLKKSDKPQNNGMVIIKCNSKFARRRKEDPSNETAPGIWDLEVEPRKSKPLFKKSNENYETPDL